MMRPKKKLDPARLRRRREPPSLEEAVFAAQGLTRDAQEQVLIAAGLIGLPEDEVRPAVLKAGARARVTTVRTSGARRSLVVEHRSARVSPARSPGK